MSGPCVSCTVYISRKDPGLDKYLSLPWVISHIVRKLIRWTRSANYIPSLSDLIVGPEEPCAPPPQVLGSENCFLLTTLAISISTTAEPN